MHGLGNDFVVVDGRRWPGMDWAQVAVKMCRRRFGVGADQLLVVEESSVADYRMRVFNPDGTEAEMCGNGIRCVAKYLAERGLAADAGMRIETLAGIIRPRIVAADSLSCLCSEMEGKDTLVEVDMGVPRLAAEEVPVDLPGEQVVDRKIEAAGRKVRITAVSLGNPHCVVFVPQVESCPVEVLGPALERHVLFPQRTNVEFVEVVAEGHLKMRVWERGAGETPACGTGACAALVAGVLCGRCRREAVVELIGGKLLAKWPQDSKSVSMIGPAEEVFSGRMEVKLT